MIIYDKAVLMLTVNSMVNNLVAGYSHFYVSIEQFHKQVKRRV
jgi:hypothetical protein